MIASACVVGCSAEAQSEGAGTNAEQSPVEAAPPATTDSPAPPPPPNPVPGEAGRDVRGEHFIPGGSFSAEVIMPPIGSAYQNPLVGIYTATLVSWGGQAVVYAIDVRSGSWIDGVTFAYYIPSQPDDLYRNGDYIGTTQFGGSGGKDNGWDFCPNGTGFGTGIQAWSQPGNPGVVTGIGLICNNLAHSNRQFTPARGTFGGSQFVFDDCANGYLMSQISGFTGGNGGYFLNGLSAICTPK